MQFGEEDLRAAVRSGALEPDRLDPLLAFLRMRAAPAPAAATTIAPPKFDLAHLLWYAGALIIITAMGLFSTLAFSAMGGKALVATAGIYAVVFTLAGDHLWRRGLHVPGGLLVAVAVSMAPLAVFGLQSELGAWSHGDPGAYQGFYVWIKGSWVFMELGAIVAGLIALRFYPFPFIVMIIAVALWFLSMDLVPWVFGKDEFSWAERRTLSLWFGLAVLAVAWIVDRRPRGGDFAFWLHLFGMLTFWSALSLSESGSELGKLLYCLLNVGLLLVSVLLGRRVYAVFGTFGIAIYLGYLAGKVFQDSLLFPFALSLIGVGVIALGLLYHRKQEALAAWMAAHLPPALANLRPAHAR